MSNESQQGIFVTLRSRKRKNVTSLYLDILKDGERRMESLKLYLTGGSSRVDKAKDKETMRQAELIKSRRLLELQNDKHGLARKENEFKKISLFAYIDELISELHAVSTRNSWISMKSRLMAYAGGRDMMLDEVTISWVKGFRKFIDNAVTFDNDPRKRKGESKNLSEGTKCLLYQKFTSVFRHAVRDGYLTANPAIGIEGFEESSAPREFLTLEELRKLITVTPPHKEVCEAFIFSCLTGLRWSDIVNLTWENVQQVNGYTRLVFKQQKTGGLEYLDLTPQAASMVDSHRGNGSENVFTNLTSIQYGRSFVTAWVKAAGIDKHITFHCGRHTFAVLMLSLDVNIYTLQKLMGHKSIETTEIYAKILDKNKQDAVCRIPDIF